MNTSRFKPESRLLQILVAATSILIIGAVGATANTIITGGTQPDGYELNVTTLQPQGIQPTEADFRANVTAIDPVYDAALVYWNYTNLNTGETYRGVSNSATNEDKVLTRVQPGLKAETSYDVKAYVQPVVWEDEKLFGNKLNQEYFVEGIVNTAVSSQTAMNKIASSSTGMNALFDTSDVGASINAPNIELSAGRGGDPKIAGAQFSTRVPKGTLTFDYTVTDSDYFAGGNRFQVLVNGNTAYSEDWGSGRETGSDSVSVSVSQGDNVEMRVKNIGSDYIDAKINVSSLSIK